MTAQSGHTESFIYNTDKDGAQYNKMCVWKVFLVKGIEVAKLYTSNCL